MRGAMNFDDYNYTNINKHVLINNVNPAPKGGMSQLV